MSSHGGHSHLDMERLESIMHNVPVGLLPNERWRDLDKGYQEPTCNNNGYINKYRLHSLSGLYQKVKGAGMSKTIEPTDSMTSQVLAKTHRLSFEWCIASC